jgi:DNA polymerase-3 subunit chi
MSEVLFYHLERRPLEQVLPALLEKTLERGWRAVVQAGSQERLEALNTQLWTYRDEAFLPHGTLDDGDPQAQPVFLTTDGNANPNGASVRFLVDGAECERAADYERFVYLFDGRDDTAVAAAREAWKAVGASGLPATYWQQDDQGRWVKKG